MQLPEEISENIKCVRDAFNLIEIDVEKSEVAGMVLAALSHQERVELAKGMFISVKLLFVATKQTPDTSAIRQLLSSMEVQEDIRGKDSDAVIDTLVINLLHAMNNDGGSFYLQLYNLKEPTSVIIRLIHIFKQFCLRFNKLGITPDILGVLGQLNLYVNQIETKTELRKKEQASLTELIHKERIFVEKAIQVMEILFPYFVSDLTEDGERVYFLSEQSRHAEEVITAVRGTDQIALLKGVCIISCLFLSMYLTVESVIPVIDERRAQLLSEAHLDDEDDDVYIQHIALNLLDSIVRLDEEDFYRQVRALDDIYGVIMSLNTSLYRTSVNGLNRTTKDIAGSLRQFLK